MSSSTSISLDPISNTVDAVSASLSQHGFAWQRATDFRRLLPNAVLQTWPAFAASWNDLGVDTYMADGGRYRRRRFSAFSVSATDVSLKPHQPHYQSRDYNALNGGIERWFQPLRNEIAHHPLMQSVLRLSFNIFNELTPAMLRPAAWHIEAHQFRIEARIDEQGQPTPEGLHRDGVDWVLVMLVARENIAEGMTTIYDLHQKPIGSFTLADAFDTAYVDDSRVYHGVTAVKPIDATRPAYRDVLVVTFRRA